MEVSPMIQYDIQKLPYIVAYIQYSQEVLLILLLKLL
jgi:hypothetical protein